MPEFCLTTERIMQDKERHVHFACTIHSYLSEQAISSAVHALVRDAVKLEQTFLRGTQLSSKRILHSI